jgi:hypothetical protein
MKKDPSGASSEFDAANGGDARIATTLALISPGTADALEAAERQALTKFGLVGDQTSWTWLFTPGAGSGSPLILSPGFSIAIGTTAAFDAGGTWEFGCHVEYFEGRRQG